jgi:hypothetical protein
MADPLYDELNATTKKEILPRVLQDNFFRNAPFLAYLRNSKAFVPFSGGAYTQQSFIYAPMIGGAYAPGSTFNLAKPQVIGATDFDLKNYETNVTEYLEEISVNNKGENAVFSLIDTHMTNALNTIQAIINIALYRHGQNVAGDDRSLHTNGLAEAINDGITRAWDGNKYTTYGRATRTAAIYNSALDSIPYFCGDSVGNAGSLTYNIFLDRYLAARRGNEEPNLIVMNKAAFGYILQKLEPKYRYQMERDPVWGANGFKFMSASVLVDDYCPSDTNTFGVNDAQLGNYSTSTFSTTGDSPAASSNLPANQTIEVGEVVFMLNVAKWLFRISDDPLFQFGFTGFKDQIDSTRIAGQMLAALTLLTTAPWAHQQLYGINS